MRSGIEDAPWQRGQRHGHGAQILLWPITFLTIVTCILDLSREFNTPFGDDPVDFPVLTWVAGIAREPLSLVTENALPDQPLLPMSPINRAIHKFSREEKNAKAPDEFADLWQEHDLSD